MNNKIFNLLFVCLVAHFTTANQSPGFNCPNDGLFKDSHNCQKYYECIWIGTPFEKQKHLKCPIDLIYSPRTHRCDPTDVFEKQFESGISTSEDLLEFMRFRNCIDEALTTRPHSQAGFARSGSFRLNNPTRMKENIHTVNKFLSENIATLARARFDFQKSRLGKVARKRILKGGRMVKSGLNKTTPVNLNTTTIEVVHRNNTEKSLLEKFLMRSGMKHISDFHFKTLYELISSPSKINRTTSMNPTSTSSVGLNETAVFDVATSGNERNASLENATLPVLTKGNSFRLRRLLAVEENDEEETTGTQIASGEFDVTDQSYQSRDQAVDKIANQLSSYKKLDKASEDAVSEQSKLIEKQIKEHLLKRNHMRFGNGRTQTVQSLEKANSNAPGLNTYANQDSINERLKNLAEFLRSESRQVVQPRVYYTPEATSVFTTKTPSLDSHLPNGQPMFTRMATKNSQLQTYIISQTKVPNYLATQRLEGGFSTNAPVDEKHNLIDCKDNDFGLECSCSITLSPPRCKKLINAFLSSCRILGCQNNGICLNMTKDFSSKYEIIFKSQIFLSNSLTL